MLRKLLLIVIIAYCFNDQDCRDLNQECYLIDSPKVHTDRRMFLRTALRELELVLTDQPGLLGPKVSEHDHIWK